MNSLHKNMIMISKKNFRVFKDLFINLLRLSPISSEVLGPPKGFYKTTRSSLCNSKKCHNDLKQSLIDIYPKSNISRFPPRTIESKIHWKFKREYERESPETFVSIIPEGRVWGDTGTVISRDDKFLADLSIELGKSESEHSILKQWRLPKIHYVNGTVVVLSTSGGENYFHWMFDVLPRIHLLNCAKVDINCVDKFCVNSYDYPFQKETLAVLGIPEEKIIESSKFPHIKAKNLIVPSLPGNTGNMPKWACDFLKQEYLINSDQVQKNELIYISRRNARYRRIINELELVEFLEKFGFRVIVLESMPVTEQALVLSSASVVIAPHGAGLSNLTFCHHGTKVIELFSPNYVNACFYACSNQMELDYYYLIGEGERPDEYIDPLFVHEDILVNINSLANLMQNAGIIANY